MKKIAFIVFIACIGTAVFAQDEDPEPKKFDATWHRLVLVDFKPGKAGEAQALIEKYESASTKAGTPMPQQFWFETGPYDMMLIWDLKNGPSDLEWDWSPDGVKWWNAFVAQEGSKEAAEEVQKNYSSLVSGSTSQILRKDK